ETTAAVESTRGVVMTHAGKLVDAVYSSNAGGVTAPSSEIWGGEIPYLQAVTEAGAAGQLLPSPAGLVDWIKGIPRVPSSQAYEASRTGFRWLRVVEREELEAKLPASARIGAIRGVRVIGRGPTGRVTRVRVYGDEGTYDLTGYAVQNAFGGLRSRWYIIETRYGKDGRPLEFFIYGAGFGHGVGMSQVGAAGLAEAGHSHEEILRFYYPGVELVRRY
ncbi:MAG TPA: SpoIID/LytB domain-containing protein, partial [Limnochordia bacterium]